MTIGRIYGDANRFSISRPGYDVLGVPRTPDYMAVDSSFPSPVRLLKSGILFGASAAVMAYVNYDETYPVPPFVELYAYNYGLSRSEQIVNFELGSGAKSYGNMITITQQTHRFGFNCADAMGYGAIVRDWIYFVYAAE